MGTLQRLHKLSCWVLGIIFMGAGCAKLMAPDRFATLIAAYGIVPDFLLLATAIGLPALEVVAGLGLLLDIRGSLWIIAGLLVLFIAILAYGIWIGLDVDCGCFSPQDPEAESFHDLKGALYRDAVMLLGVVLIFGWRLYNGIRSRSISEIINLLRKKRSQADGYV